MKRRLFLKGTLASSAVAVAAGAGLLAPAQVIGAWNKGAFESKSIPDALQALLGSSAHESSDKVEITAPDIAENGAVVPVTIKTSLPAETISLLTEKNASPLTASFVLAAAADKDVSVRIKMGQTSNLVAVVKAGGKYYSATKEVKVTVGGCGG
jgi:sulfur-oxidizing protein SoxY